MGNEKQNDFKYNKKLVEELVAVLEIFVEALDSLQSTAGPTSNKILPWWSALREHLYSGDKHSIEMKRSIKLAQRLFEVEFAPTMEHKVACFLDPRYRLLKMLSVDELNEIIVKVKQNLGNMPVISTYAAADLLPNPPAKKSKFSHLEANEHDIEEQDEVSKYVHSTDLKPYNLSESDFHIIGMFWNNNKEKLPKLYFVWQLKGFTFLHAAAVARVL